MNQFPMIYVNCSSIYNMIICIYLHIYTLSIFIYTRRWEQLIQYDSMYFRHFRPQDVLQKQRTLETQILQQGSQGFRTAHFFRTAETFPV